MKLASGSEAVALHGSSGGQREPAAVNLNTSSIPALASAGAGALQENSTWGLRRTRISRREVPGWAAEGRGDCQWESIGRRRKAPSAIGAQNSEALVGHGVMRRAPGRHRNRIGKWAVPVQGMVSDDRVGGRIRLGVQGLGLAGRPCSLPCPESSSRPQRSASSEATPACSRGGRSDEPLSRKLKAAQARPRCNHTATSKLGRSRQLGGSEAPEPDGFLSESRCDPSHGSIRVTGTLRSESRYDPEALVGT
jgi:hypothetical protein